MAGSVEDLVLDEAAGSSKAVRGITTAAGDTILAPNVVITTGTFLKGKVRHVRTYVRTDVGERGLTTGMPRVSLPHTCPPAYLSVSYHKRW